MALRIINIIHSFRKSDGGSVTAVTEISNMLISLGHKSEIVTCSTDPHFFDKNVKTFSTSFPHRFTFSKKATRYIEDCSSTIDLVILHGVWTGVYHTTAKICRKNRIPYFIIPHGSLDPFDLRKKALLKRLLGLTFVHTFLAGADRIVCSTETEANLLETYGSQITRHVINWPVTTLTNTTPELTRQSARIQFGISDDEYVILFLSRINYKKGLPLLLHASDLAGKQIKGLRLLVAGDGCKTYFHQIRNIASNIKNCRVDFLGFLTGHQRDSAFAASDIFALVSDNENFGFAIIEALAHGLPCVISDQVYLHNELDAAGAVYVTSRTVERVSKAILDSWVDVSDNRQLLKMRAFENANQYCPENLKDEYIKLLSLINTDQIT